jgi:hypothetical protein
MANGIKVDPMMMVAAAVLVYIFFIRKRSGYGNFQRPVRRSGIEHDGYIQLSSDKGQSQASHNFAPAPFE